MCDIDLSSVAAWTTTSGRTSSPSSCAGPIRAPTASFNATTRRWMSSGRVPARATLRLHRTLGATVGAPLLALAVPTSAHATTGDFLYKTSTGQNAGLSDANSGIRINLLGTTAQEPGHSPQNFTVSTATVFAEQDCEGDTCTAMNPGTKLGEEREVGSVIFS
ncbi:hypothetical protein ACFYN3_32030 [Streptomyces lavendulae]|uniref:hypothetical protein n=1 Tax=Streptomyces lavendulae TaxID=1914 RepID=UPI003696F006